MKVAVVLLTLLPVILSMTVEEEKAHAAFKRLTLEERISSKKQGIEEKSIY